MQEFYILLVDIYVFFLPLSSGILAGAAVCLKLILSPKRDFYCTKNIKRKMIDLIWSIYVVLKNSIIVFANCEKKCKIIFAMTDRAVVCLDSYVLLTTLPNLLDQKEVFWSQTYFYIVHIIYFCFNSSNCKNFWAHSSNCTFLMQKSTTVKSALLSLVVLSSWQCLLYNSTTTIFYS